MPPHPFVIAPRPNVAAKLATVGPCHTRACVSRYVTPRRPLPFHWIELNALVSVQPPIMTMPGVRLTTSPLALVGMKVLSRVFLMWRGVPGSAASPEYVSPLLGAG